MAVSRVKTSSILQGFPKSRSLLAGNTAYDPAATWLIQRVAGTGTNSITFSSIPSTYKHLQIRGLAICSSATQTIRTQFNANTGTNYMGHYLSGNGTAASAGSIATSNTYTLVGGINAGVVTTYPNLFILDIHDYASTTKYKTTRSFFGADMNAAGGSVDLCSGLYMSTTAISEIKIYMSTGNLNTGTTFALYGMVG